MRDFRLGRRTREVCPNSVPGFLCNQTWNKVMAGGTNVGQTSYMTTDCTVHVLLPFGSCVVTLIHLPPSFTSPLLSAQLFRTPQSPSAPRNKYKKITSSNSSHTHGQFSVRKEPEAGVMGEVLCYKERWLLREARIQELQCIWV